MKQKHKIYRLVAVVLVTLAASLVLSACSGHTLVYESGNSVDEQSGVTYRNASTSYEPVALGEVYGKLEVGNMSYTVHEIPGMDTKQWLATSEGDVLYAGSMTLPTLTEMEPTAVHVCMDAATVVEVDVLRNQTAVRTLADQLENGTSVTRPVETAPVQYTLRFESERYPGLYYTVTYLEYVTAIEENGVNYGHYFLYERMSGSTMKSRLVAVDDTIHKLLEGTDEVTDTTAQAKE